MLTCVCREDDTKWPVKNKDGRTELEIRMGKQHISFEASSPTVALLPISSLQTC